MGKLKEAYSTIYNYFLLQFEDTIFAFQKLLRARENEVQSLKKEISCLQNEVQSLTKVCILTELLSV